LSGTAATNSPFASRSRVCWRTRGTIATPRRSGEVGRERCNRKIRRRSALRFGVTLVAPSLCSVSSHLTISNLKPYVDDECLFQASRKCSFRMVLLGLTCVPSRTNVARGVLNDENRITSFGRTRSPPEGSTETTTGLTTTWNMLPFACTYKRNFWV